MKKLILTLILILSAPSIMFTTYGVYIMFECQKDLLRSESCRIIAVDNLGLGL